MTLLGKIFTVLIFIMCILFMGFAVSVYMTHKNWREVVTRPQSEVTAGKPLGLAEQLRQLKDTNERLRENLQEIETELRRERAARASALAALEESYQQEVALRKQADAANVLLAAANREAIAAMNATQGRLDALKTEVSGLRDEVKVAQADRDDKLQRVVFLTDQLHQAYDTRRRLQDRQSELVTQIARMKNVLDKKGLNEFENVDGIPPPLDGVVLAAKSPFIELSLGSDDGLMVGHQLDVSRGNQYLGRVVVRKTDPDRSVAEILPDLRKGEMQRGDRVITRTRPS